MTRVLAFSNLHHSPEKAGAIVAAGATTLHGEGATVAGARLFGIGHVVPVVPVRDWSCDLTEARAAALLDRCEGADVLMSHSPPQGVADVTSAGRSIGSAAVTETARRVTPKLLLCGHVHDSWGAPGQIGETRAQDLGPPPSRFEV